jgi:hypothetical protein
MLSKKVTGVSRAVHAEAVQVVQEKIAHSVWATPSRDSPNAAKLLDGAIQRESVSVPLAKLAFTHQNPEKIGAFKRPEHNVSCSATAHLFMAPWDRQQYRSKIARIYMPQRKHLHCHPTDKRVGKGWAIEFDSWGQYKSPLMGWTSATSDTYSDVTIRVGKL